MASSTVTDPVEHIKKREPVKGMQDDVSIVGNGNGNGDIELSGDSNERSLLFRGVQDLFTRLKACTTETFFIFSGVSTSDYEALVKSQAKRRQRLHFDLWNRGELWITAVPSSLHEKLHGYLNDRILVQTSAMGLDCEWASVGTTRFHAANGSSSEGDACRKPRSQRPTDLAWPTLVIEAGVSQSMRNLRNKARWWFEASNYDVKIVILAKLFPISKQIMVEKWIAVPSQPASGPATRSLTLRIAAQAPTPACVQTITTKSFPGTTLAQLSDFNSFQVTSSPLVLEFELLFLRLPGPGENNISIEVRHFQDLASWIWPG